MIKNHLIPFKKYDYPFDFVSWVVFLDDHIEINFKITGDTSKIAFEAPSSTPNRVVGLWKKTCLELFLRSGNPKEYVEFNFSPSTDWNCFIFNETIEELTPYKDISSVDFLSQNEDCQYSLKVKIKETDLPKAHRDFSKIEFSTTAVLLIENSEGKLEETFWAINHCDSRPNFHHPDSYIKN